MVVINIVYCIFKQFMFKGVLIVGDQSGSLHIWDLNTDSNERLVTAVLSLSV